MPDRNAYSFLGDSAGNVWLNGVRLFTADQGPIREYVIEGDVVSLPVGQDTLKFSGVERLKVTVVGRVIGGTEDCCDFNNGCDTVEVIALGGFASGGQYVATIKGRCRNITLRGQVLTHGAVVDFDIDNYSDQSHRRSEGITLDCYSVSSSVTWRSWRSTRPTFPPLTEAECLFCLPSWVGFVVNSSYQIAKKLKIAA